MTDKTFLDKAYGIDSSDEIQKLYAEWAKSYETEIIANGYATPTRIADALSECTREKSLPILDYGCGTGLSGNALSQNGFSQITGADPSAEMLAFAGSKGVYSKLVKLDILKPPPFEKGAFSAITAIGVIGTGAAPVEVFDALFGLLNTGQKFALSLNDHALAVPEFPDRVKQVVQSGQGNLIFEEFGDHLPGQHMKAMVYIIEKT